MASSIFGFQLVKRDDPLANPRSLRAWLAGVPRNDPVIAVESINALLAGESPRVDGSADRLQAVIDLDRIAVPMLEMLRQQYRLPAISDDVRQRLLRACDGLSAGFTIGYNHFAKLIETSGEPVKARADWHGVYARWLFHIGIITRLGLFRYEQWIPGRWRALHSGYLAARGRSLVLEPFTLDPENRPGDQATAEQEYLQILLLHRLNTGNLTTPQIDWAGEWLREWVAPLRLAPAGQDQEHEQEGGGYWLDPAQGEGLRDRRPQHAGGDLLYLDMEPLRAQLRALIGRLSTQSGGVPVRGAGDMEDLLGLAKRLDRLWLPQAPVQARRGERRAVNHAVTVAAGWADITLGLVARSARSTGAPIGYHYDDYGRLRNNKEMRRTNYPRRAERDAWQVFDSSESGFRIRSLSREAARQWPGALLALQVEDQPGWQLGIVRRLKRVGAELTELGVEVISRNVSLVTPKEVDIRDSGYSVDGVDVKGKSFQALYLPPQVQTRVRTPASLVIPPSEFTLNRRLSLAIEGTAHSIMLASPLERTRDWVWAPLRSG